MMDTRELTRQELCAKLRISESTVRRLELDGLPCTPVGRSKRYERESSRTASERNRPHTSAVRTR